MKKLILLAPALLIGLSALSINAMGLKPSDTAKTATTSAQKALDIPVDKPEVKPLELPKTPTPPAVAQDIKPSTIGIEGGLKKTEIKSEKPAVTPQTTLFADLKDLEKQVNKTMLAAEQYVQKNPKEREKVLAEFENVFAAMVGGLVKVAGEDLLKAMEAEAQKLEAPTPAKRPATKALSADEVFYNEVEADSQE